MRKEPHSGASTKVFIDWKRQTEPGSASYSRRRKTDGAVTSDEPAARYPKRNRTLAGLKAQYQLGGLPRMRQDKPLLSEMVSIMKAIKRTNRDPKGHFRYLDEIMDFFGADTLVEAIDEIAIDRFRQQLDIQPKRGFHRGLLSNRSKDHRLVELRHLLKVAQEKGMIAHFPRIRLYGNYGKRSITLSRRDFYQLVELMPGPPKPHQAISGCA